jgi:hypothetical protein
MRPFYEKIDPEDRDSILWLQLAMAKLYPGPGSITHIGQMGPMTEKVLRLYQIKHKLSLTGQPDELTVQKIKQELRERNITL